MRCEPTRRSFMAAIGAAAAGAARPPITLARDEPSAPAYRTAGELVEALAGKEGRARLCFTRTDSGCRWALTRSIMTGKADNFRAQCAEIL